MVTRCGKYERLFYQYLDDVRNGKRIAGKLERQAVARFDIDRERERIDASYPYRFNMRLAESSCEFFELFKHSDGEYAGRAFDLHGWQVFVVFQLFGWQSKSTGLRRFREAFISVGRGNGKSPFGALLILLAFCFDVPIEERAECYTAAVKRDQAGISFEAAKRFVDSSPLKGEYITITRKKLEIIRSHSTFEPLSSDAKSADGLNTHGLLCDELHAWTEFQRDYWEKLRTSMGKRRQPLWVTITTAGDEESLLWLEQQRLVESVLDPESKVEIDSLFAMVFQMDEEDSEFAETSWHKANPMLEAGVVKIAYLRDEAEKAKTNPGLLLSFRRYHCNRLTRSANKAFTPELWDLGAQPIPYGQIKSAYAGVDLGWNDDLAGTGYVAPLGWVSVEGQSKRVYAVWSHCFIPAGTKRDITREPYRTWIASKRLVKTDSEWTDTAPIYKALNELNNTHGIKSLAYDPSNAREFALNCENELGIPTFAFAQKHAKYNEAFCEFVIALSEGRILHGGDSLLRWCALNVIEDVNNIGHKMPSKKRSQDKIDPFVAVLMAFSEAMFSERKKPSIYETRGPLIPGEEQQT